MKNTVALLCVTGVLAPASCAVKFTGNPVSI